MRNKNSSEHRRKVKFGGIDYKNTMTEVRNFAEIAPNLPFTEYDFNDLYRETFEKSELGRIASAANVEVLVVLIEFTVNTIDVWAYTRMSWRIGISKSLQTLQ